VRKIPALVTVLSLAALSLVGCASVSAPGCTRPASAGADLQSQVTVTGQAGSAPKVSIGAPMHIARSATWESIRGSGTPLTADSQLFTLDFSVYDGTTGTQTYTSGYTSSPTISLTQWEEVFPGTGNLMTCATPGSRVVLALAPDAIAEASAANLGLKAGDSAVVVVDVSQTFLPRATGSLVFNDARNMPTVVRAPSGQPGIIVPETTAPSKIAVQTLIRGDGEVLKDSDTAVVAYTGVPWETHATVFDTTWGATPSAVTLASTDLPGFAEALTGRTVGSQVLVVVPAGQVPAGTTANVPTGKTLVYVIDILGTAAPAASGR